ncbi:MAG: DUF58 domain-containing protein [Fibrobacteres bacterium]|nr:DUF58 domain-containing protein [Fibrobacterota bacterium]
MIPSDVIKKIRRIEIRTRRLVNDVLSGEYQSAFKGRGMEFSEVREYTPGDEIRSIDWNVTARYGKPYVKIFKEERELTIIFVVDVSGSGDFGTIERMKGEIGVELCAGLAFSAVRNNDKIGLLLFSSENELYLPPKKGKNHALRVIRELLFAKPKKKGTDIASAISYINQIVKKKAVIFLVSDFLDKKDYLTALRVANKRHDIVAVTLTDPREEVIPPIGLVDLEDPETGEEILVDTSDLYFQDTYKKKQDTFKDDLAKGFRKIGVDKIDVRTDHDYVEPLLAFFHKRGKRKAA